jgi:hypothetical protein
MLNFDLKVVDSIKQLISTFDVDCSEAWTRSHHHPTRAARAGTPVSSRFRICAAFDELYWLSRTKPNQYLTLKLV